VQILQTARQLESLGIEIDIRLANEKILYEQYDLLHFFNLTRPSDILPHIQRTRIPYVVTPLLIDYSEYDRKYRKGIAGKLFRHLSPDGIEYVKTMARWLKRQPDRWSYAYFINGQRRSIQMILRKASMLLPNSRMEYDRLIRSYSVEPPFSVIPNGIDENLFTPLHDGQRHKNTVLCVARIEGLKNQLNLIRALNHSGFQLFLIGDASPNQMGYYRQCRKAAARNVHFIHHLPQELLLKYYQRSQVHILPSWFETCGLSTLEAAAMGCHVVITDRGYASEYCNGHAGYCDPSSPSSILDAVRKASRKDDQTALRQKIRTEYTWQNAAIRTKEAYYKIIHP
jgi:glycosyltransferase involved in cell wall biosynthesis